MYNYIMKETTKKATEAQGVETQEKETRGSNPSQTIKSFANCIKNLKRHEMITANEEAMLKELGKKVMERIINVNMFE